MTIDEEIELRYANVMLRKATQNGECIECHFSTATHGYCKVAGGELAHRFMFRVKKGPIGDLWVLHSCDNRRCINTEHLFLGTQQDNSADCLSKDRFSKDGRPKLLTDDDVTKVFSLRAEGMLKQEIANKFFVSVGTITNTLKGYRYARSIR